MSPPAATVGDFKQKGITRLWQFIICPLDVDQSYTTLMIWLGSRVHIYTAFNRVNIIKNELQAHAENKI